MIYSPPSLSTSSVQISVTKKTSVFEPAKESHFNLSKSLSSGQKENPTTPFLPQSPIVSFETTYNTPLSPYIDRVEDTIDEGESTDRKRVQLLQSFGILQVVTPTPAFVIKTKRMMDNTKVFVNVCSHDLVPYNRDDESYLMSYMLVGPPIEHMNEKDSSYCVVYDVVVHPDEIKNSVTETLGTRVSWLNFYSIIIMLIMS